jgi:hypothetical protein
MSIDLFSSNPSLPVHWPCTPLVPGLGLAPRPWGRKPWGTNHVNKWYPSLDKWASHSASAISPRACCWKMLGCTALAHPHVAQAMRGNVPPQAATVAHPSRYAAREGRNTGVTSATERKFAIWSRWRMQSRPA